jgi:glycosyltransferase involved in cell wall biosynthesis
VRILHLTDRLSERGGAHRHLLSLLEAQANEHEVCLGYGRDDGAAAPCPSVRVAGLDARTRAPHEAAALRAAFAPDVVHLHTVVNPAVLEWACGEPAVMTVQDHRYFCPTRGKWTARGEVCREPMRPEVCAACFEDGEYFGHVHALTAERLAAVRRLRLVVLSRYMRDELLAVGVPAEQVSVIPPFVHGLDHLAEPAIPPCVLFVGRLAESKGVADAVEAWRHARLDLPLVFAGTGPLRARLEADGFTVLGWLDRARLAGALRGARALLMPPRWQEPFGIAGLEALALGVPVVAWRSGGIAEWHPGPLVEWGDVAGLAAALRAAVGAPRAQPPAGFEPGALLARLARVYQDTAVS